MSLKLKGSKLTASLWPSIPAGPAGAERGRPQTGVHHQAVSGERPPGQRLPAGPL